MVVLRFGLTGRVRRGSSQIMRSELAITGTSALLQQLSVFIPDEFINQLVRPNTGRGRRSHWSSAQLYRLLLLTLLTPAHSFNLMLHLLEEQQSWRKFAHLPNRYRLPVASQLHDFRQAIGVGGLRRINEFLLDPLLQSLLPQRKTIGLIDATDLPAATSAYKKRLRVAIRRTGPHWAGGPSRPARVVGLLATKSTRCVYGFISARTKFC